MPSLRWVKTRLDPARHGPGTLFRHSIGYTYLIITMGTNAAQSLQWKNQKFRSPPSGFYTTAYGSLVEVASHQT